MVGQSSMENFQVLRLNDPGSLTRRLTQEESKNQSVTGRLGLNHVAQTGHKSFTQERISIFQYLRVGNTANISKHILLKIKS